MAAAILLIEDDADSSAALVEMITDRGHSVRCAVNGQEAFDLLEGGFRPQLILVDLLLPYVSGWDLLTYLQGDPDLRHTPTIVMTAVPRQQVRVVADVVFSKPLDFDLLARTIEGLLARSSAS